jgi:hypothetical protein
VYVLHHVFISGANFLFGRPWSYSENFESQSGVHLSEREIGPLVLLLLLSLALLFLRFSLSFLFVLPPRRVTATIGSLSISPIASLRPGPKRIGAVFGLVFSPSYARASTRTKTLRAEGIRQPRSCIALGSLPSKRNFSPSGSSHVRRQLL